VVSAEEIIAAALQNGHRPEIEPDDFPEFLSYEPFPLDALPTGVRTYVEAVAEGFNMDSAVVAACALTTLSAGIGMSMRVEVTSDWYEPVTLWTGIVMSPGQGKTPLIREVTGPIEDKDIALYQNYEIEKYKWESTPKKDRNELPQRQQVVVNDITVEKLADVLNTNPHGVMMIRDELAGLIDGLDQYKGGRGSDRKSMLSLWSGTTWRVDRVSSGSKVVAKPFTAILGGIQPALLTKLSGEDGLAARFLYAYLPRPAARWPLAPVPQAVREFWRATIHTLLRVAMAGDLAHPLPNIRKFSPEAKKAWDGLYLRHMKERDSDLLDHAMEGAHAKLDSYAARFAGILCDARLAEESVRRGETGKLIAAPPSRVAEINAAIDGDDPPPPTMVEQGSRFNTDALITEQDMRNAWKLAEWFKSQDRRVFGVMEQTPDERETTRLYAWLQKREGHCATLREVARVHIARNTTDALRLGKRMEAKGWAKVDVQTKESGQKSPTITLVNRPD